MATRFEPGRDPDIRMHVHERGDSSLDGMLRLIETAGQQSPLAEVLCVMCAEVAAIAAADVVSAYVRESGGDGDVLVMQGNVGFPREAVGSISLRVGEGIAGFAAECMRPVSVAVAGAEPHYKHIRGLGEEDFPSFLAVPVLCGPRASGVLVLQRRAGHEFTAREVVLATALAAPLAFAIDAAERRVRDRAADAAGSRVARLRGVPVAGGVAMGRIAVVPTLTALADQWSRRDGSAQPPPLADALCRLERDLDKARRQLRGDGDPAVPRALSNLELVLSDHRFREQVVEGCLRDGLVAGLAGVARDYARVPYRVAARDASMEALLAERSREVEDLCVMLYGLATGERFLQPGRIWATDRLGAFLALCAVARGAGAVVIDGDAATRCPGAAIARAGQIPAVAEVTGLFAWARPGDLLVVDGDGGGVRVNPASASVARFRKEAAERRKG